VAFVSKENIRTTDGKATLPKKVRSPDYFRRAQYGLNMNCFSEIVEARMRVNFGLVFDHI